MHRHWNAEIMLRCAASVFTTACSNMYAAAHLAASGSSQIARATFWEKLTQPQQARAHAGRSNLALPLGPVTAGSRTLQTAEYGVRMGDSRSVPSKRFLISPIGWGSSGSYRRWLAFDSPASVCVFRVFGTRQRLTYSYLFRTCSRSYVHHSLFFHVAL